MDILFPVSVQVEGGGMTKGNCRIGEVNELHPGMRGFRWFNNGFITGADYQQTAQKDSGILNYINWSKNNLRIVTRG